MTTNELVLVGCRFFALYVLISALNTLFIYSIGLLSILGDSGVEGFLQVSTIFVFPGLIVFLLYFAIAWILWFKAKKIAGLIWPPSEGSEAIFQFSVQEAQTAGFALIGVFLLVTAISDLGKLFFSINLQKGFDIGSKISFDSQSAIFKEILKIALGIALFFGSQGLSGLLKLVRELGNK